MKQSARFLLAFAVAAAAVPVAVHAHFRLLEPASWLVESERGDPQKMAPCGTDPDPMTFERTTERGPQSVWAVIQSPPQIPVIAASPARSARCR